MPMINRTCGTAIEGARFITLLISGNNISTVEANSPCIICSDKVEMCKYTSQKVFIILCRDIIWTRQ